VPQIPQVSAPTLTPPPEMNPSVAGKPGMALANAADQFGQVADYAAQVAGRIKQAQDEGILLNASNNIDADMEKAHAGLANWSPKQEELGQQTDQIKQDTANALREKYADQYGNRPELWRHIEGYLGKELNSYDRNVDVKSAQLTEQYNQSALIVSQRNAVNKAATEPTLDGKEFLWAQQDATTDLMLRNGSITPLDAERAKTMLRSQTIATEVDHAANPLNPPEIMEQEINRLKEYEGKGYVDPKELEQMQDHLATSYERAITRADRIDVSKQGDAVLTAAKNDPTNKDPETREFDHMLAAKKIDDNPDLPTKVKQYARRELEEEAGATQKLQNDKDQKILDSLDPHVESGALTFAEISKRMNLAAGQPDYIPRRVGDHLLSKAAQIQRMNRTEDLQERAMMKQEARDKSSDIASQILSAGVPLVSKSDLTPYIQKGLSQQDANALWSTLDLQKDNGWHDAVRMINASPLYDTTTDEGRAKLAHDTLNFAQTVKNKNLHGAQITQELQNELHPAEEAHKQSTVKGLLDNIWPMMRQIVTGQPGTFNASPNASKTAVPVNSQVVTQSFQGHPVPGMVTQGNLDITKRPNVDNGDGTHSSTFSMSFGTDKGEVLVPGVGDGSTYPARKLTEKEALNQYRKTGKNFGTFKTVAQANAYAETLHEDQAKYGNAPARPKGVPENAVWNGEVKQWQIPNK
jgi:hypothetical protein